MTFIESLPTPLVVIIVVVMLLCTLSREARRWVLTPRDRALLAHNRDDDDSVGMDLDAA